MKRKKKLNIGKFTKFDVVDYLKTDQDIVDYLTVVLEDSDPTLFVVAIPDMLQEPRALN